MSRRTFFAAFALTALLLAGVVSYYASAHPDGLEFVAEKTGFIDSARDSAASDSPLADYQASGVENERLSGGIAGVVGTLVTLAVAGGGFWLLGRRRSSTDDA